jgi:hypothetical protein
MLGSGTGMQMYFLIDSTLGALLFGTDRARFESAQTLYCFDHNVLAGLRLSKLATSQAASKSFGVWQSDAVTHDPAADQHDQADDRRNSDPDAVIGRALRHHFEMEGGVAEGKNGKLAQYPQIASS